MSNMENNNKTITAVEWLLEEMIFRLAIRIENLTDGVKLVEQAKQIEKEQMIEFADKYGFDICHYDYDRAEEYYERTYKQQDNGTI